MNVVVLTFSNWYSVTGSYFFEEASHPAPLGNLDLLGGNFFSAQEHLRAADCWVICASNESLSNNAAICSSAPVVAAVNAFTSSNNMTYVQSLVKQAQTQIYNDAPYAWIGALRLIWGDGSIVWSKAAVKGFDIDPL